MNCRLFSFLLFVGTIVKAQDALTTCYAFNGDEYGNNTICPGSNACCNFEHTCLSNRLCHNPNDGDSTFIRGPCAVEGYDSITCPQICLYDETGIFPRVTLCADGSLCCDDDPQCCGNGDGRFLDNDGLLADRPPETTFSWGPERTESGFLTDITTSSTSATTTSSASTTSTDAQASSSVADGGGGNDDADDGTGLKIGLGVGIPVGCIVLGGAIAFFLWRRRRAARVAAATQEVPPVGVNYYKPEQPPIGHLYELPTSPGSYGTRATSELAA